MLERLPAPWPAAHFLSVGACWLRTWRGRREKQNVPITGPSRQQSAPPAAGTGRRRDRQPAGRAVLLDPPLRPDASFFHEHRQQRRPLDVPLQHGRAVGRAHRRRAGTLPLRNKVAEGAEHTGPLAIILANRNGRTLLWEPFSRHSPGVYRIERNLYKNAIGDKIVFESPFQRRRRAGDRRRRPGRRNQPAHLPPRRAGARGQGPGPRGGVIVWWRYEPATQTTVCVTAWEAVALNSEPGGK